MVKNSQKISRSSAWLLPLGAIWLYLSRLDLDTIATGKLLPRHYLAIQS